MLLVMNHQIIITQRGISPHIDLIFKVVLGVLQPATLLF